MGSGVSGTEAKHPSLTKDLAALGVSQKQELKSSAIKILAGYSRVHSIRLPVLLQELVHAGSIKLDEDALSAATTLKAKPVESKVTTWDAGSEPTFVRLRDPRGQRMKMVFLGNLHEHAGDEGSPNAVLVQHWGLAKPSTAITLDAGTTHPSHCDSEADDDTGGGLATLPKFKQFLAEAGETKQQRQTRENLQRQSSRQSEQQNDEEVRSVAFIPRPLASHLPVALATLADPEVAQSIPSSAGPLSCSPHTTAEP